MKNRVQQALDSTLSSLYVSERDARLLLEQAKGGRKAKKKLSVATALLIALIAISITAFAIISLQRYYEKTIEKEGSYGLIKDWSAKDHIDFVELMTEAGIKLDEGKLAQMRDPTLKEEIKGRIAWELIQEYYPARDGVLTSVDIIAKEKGPVEYWSLEDKAWFSEQMLKCQPDNLGSINILPGEGDVSQEEAEKIFFDYYKTQYGLEKSNYDLDTFAASFSEVKTDSGVPRKEWGFSVFLKDDSEFPLGMAVQNDGRICFAVIPHSGEAIIFEK